MRIMSLSSNWPRPLTQPVVFTSKGMFCGSSLLGRAIGVFFPVICSVLNRCGTGRLRKTAVQGLDGFQVDV